MQFLQGGQPFVPNLFDQSFDNFHDYSLVLAVVNVENFINDFPSWSDVAWYYVLENVDDKVFDEDVWPLKDVQVCW